MKILGKLIFLNYMDWDFKLEVVFWVYRIKEKVFMEVFFFDLMYGAEARILSTVEKELLYFWSGVCSDAESEG